MPPLVGQDRQQKPKLTVLASQMRSVMQLRLGLPRTVRCVKELAVLCDCILHRAQAGRLAWTRGCAGGRAHARCVCGGLARVSGIGELWCTVVLARVRALMQD